MNQVITIESFNPYECRFPGRKLIDSSTLKLIKILRQNGYKVKVNPDNNQPVEYLYKKGISDWFNDPTFLSLFNIPTSIIAGLIINYIQKLIDEKEKRISSEAISNIYITNNTGNVTIDLTQRALSRGEKTDILSKRMKTAKEFEKCFNAISPYPNLPTPLLYEHKPKIVGWAQIASDDYGVKILDSHISDKNIFRKIESGKIKGGSMTGIVERSECSVCSGNYVECEHIAGEVYNDIQCNNIISQATPIEFSLVKHPVNELALIQIVKNQRW